MGGACHSIRPVVRQVGEDQYVFQDRRTGRPVGGPYLIIFNQLNTLNSAVLPRRSTVVEWDTVRHQFWLINAWGQRLAHPFLLEGLPDDVAGGLMRYQNEAKQVGFLNRRGRVRIPAQYTIAYPFYRGFSKVGQGCHLESLCPGDTEHQVWRGGRWGVIDRRGRVVIPLQYDALLSIAGRPGWLAAVKGSDTTLLRRNGRPLPPQPYKVIAQACSPNFGRPPSVDSLSIEEQQAGKEWGKP